MWLESSQVGLNIVNDLEERGNAVNVFRATPANFHRELVPQSYPIADGVKFRSVAKALKDVGPKAKAAGAGFRSILRTAVSLQSILSTADWEWPLWPSGRWRDFQMKKSWVKV
jgi:hypothetical protein